MKYILLIGYFLLTGCSQKVEPVSLETGSYARLGSNKYNKFAPSNKKILSNIIKTNNVPLDKSFEKERYSYIINTEKKGTSFFDNDILVRSFYLLHHANLIVITGNINIANDYMVYLLDNGVAAPIVINDASIASNKVIIDTIHYSPISKNKDKTKQNNVFNRRR